jgi:hypothetical protein
MLRMMQDPEDSVMQASTRCKQCSMLDVRDVESDLTLLLELDYNDILQAILD